MCNSDSLQRGHLLSHEHALATQLSHTVIRQTDMSLQHQHTSSAAVRTAPCLALSCPSRSRFWSDRASKLALSSCSSPAMLALRPSPSSTCVHRIVRIAIRCATSAIQCIGPHATLVQTHILPQRLQHKAQHAPRHSAAQCTQPSRSSWCAGAVLCAVQAVPVGLGSAASVRCGVPGLGVGCAGCRSVSEHCVIRVCLCLCISS